MSLALLLPRSLIIINEETTQYEVESIIIAPTSYCIVFSIKNMLIQDVQCCYMLLQVVQCCYMLLQVVQCCYMLCSAVACYILCSVVTCCAVLLHVVQYCYILLLLHVVQCC